MDENTFTASIDGVNKTFNLSSAALVRSALVDKKRIDIGGISQDRKYVLILSIIEDTSKGDGVTVSQYIVRQINKDDPDTEEDESINSNTIISLGTYNNLNELETDNYVENGTMSVTDCNEKKHLISGNFSLDMSSRNGGADYTVTDGAFENIHYSVIN